MKFTLNRRSSNHTAMLLRNPAAASSGAASASSTRGSSTAGEDPGFPVPVGVALEPEELEEITGGDLSTLIDVGCAFVGGAGSGWALVGYLAKRAAVSVACPACGAALGIAGFACLFF